MLKVATKEELCQISLTGLRAFIILGLLIKEPQSLEDIRREFLHYNIIADTSSNDILRIDLNTLRIMGCKISRADKSTNFKYKLISHPFSLNVTDEEINLLRRAYKRIKENADVQTLLKYDDLFKKLSKHITDEELKEKLIGISPVKSYKSNLIKKLIEICHNKCIVRFEYKSPVAKNNSEIELAAQDVIFKNDKFYLWGVDTNSGKNLSFNIKRILKLLSYKTNDRNYNADSDNVHVKFLLKSFGISGLEENEKIIEITKEDKYIIEGSYHNEFYATQRILSFGSDCTVIEPEEFKNRIIELLKKMRNIYNG